MESAQQEGIDTPGCQRRALIGREGCQSRAGSHWAQARKCCGCVVAVGVSAAIFKSVASPAPRAGQLRLLSPCFGPLARAGAARAVPSVQRALRRSDVDGPAPCSAAPSSRRACGGGTDRVPRPRIVAASRPLGARRRTCLSRVSRGVRRAAIDPDLEPLPGTDFRELGREAAPTVADLQWRVQSGPYFSGEGYSDSPAGWKCSHPSWSPPLSCPARRCLPLTPALDACRYHRPPMPSSADADVAAFSSAHGPPLRDPSDSYHCQQGPPLPGTRLPGSHAGLATLQQPQVIVSTGNNFVCLKSTHESST
ncbi:uncharacterized protein [Manis javanica]|uniref:uncharacterized protein n=1 Tax=Manis javanica TaxID=9974 RepID=UPI003C6DA736